MVRFLLLVSLSCTSLASYFEYTGRGQIFNEQGPSQFYDVGLNIIPDIYGDQYYFARINSQGTTTVSDCFTVRPFPLHQQSRDRFVILAPTEVSPSFCNDLDSYQPVGWGHSWYDDDKFILLMTIDGKQKGEYSTLKITKWSQREESDHVSFFVEVAGFDVVTEDHGELSLGRYWQETYVMR